MGGGRRFNRYKWFLPAAATCRSERAAPAAVTAEGAGGAAWPALPRPTAAVGGR